MQKHPDITQRRIDSWLALQLVPLLERGRVPMSIQYCPVEHFTEREALDQGPWSPVEEGFEWGPAYKTAWFRLEGEIPSDWAGGEVFVLPEVGGERTLWENNSPARGVDWSHKYLRIADQAKGGEKLSLTFQSHAGAPHIKVHGDIPERKETTEKVSGAFLVLGNPKLQALVYDVKFCISLLKSVPKTDPGYMTILEGLNAAANLWAISGQDSIAAGRKAIKDALGQLSTELNHTVFAYGHAHLDTAWLWPLHITHLKMAHTAGNQLYLMERYPEHVYVHSQASQYEWVQNEYPELFQRIKAAAKRGQWEPIGSMWVEADCNLTGGESLIRQFLYGRRYFEQHFGKATVDMFLPDVFGYSAALPQILQKFGIEYFVTQKISWNQINKFPHNTFWWKGIDGSKVWTHFPPADTYIGTCEPEEIARSVSNHRDHARSNHSMYLYGWGDGGGGPTEDHLEYLRRARTAPYLPVIEKKRTAVDFFKEASAQSKNLMTWHGELYLEFHRGTYTSQAFNKRSNRESEFLLRDLELLACFQENAFRHYPAAELERLWKLILLNQFHDIIPGSSVPEVYRDSDRDYADILSSGYAMLDVLIKNIASKLNREGMHYPVAIFANAVKRTQASLPWKKGSPPKSIVVGEEVLPVQFVEDANGPQVLFATPVEALGSVCVADLREEAPPTPPKSRLKVGPKRLENDRWSVKIDGNGNITSITSVEDPSLEFIAPGKLANLFQLFDDHPLFWEAWDIEPFMLETVTNLTKADSVEVVENGPVRIAIETVRTFGKSKIRQRISLGPTPGIRFDTWVDWHESRKMLKVAFPLNVVSQRATFEIQLGHVERPTHRNTSWDAAKTEVCAQKWADMSETGHGVALLNQGKYGHDVYENMLRLSLLRSPKAPDPECDMGSHFFSYVVYPHFDTVTQSDTVASAYAFNAEPRVVPVEAGSGIAASTPRFVTCGSRNLVVETVKKSEDGEFLLVRAYECHGARGSTEISTALPIKNAWLSDLNEVPIGALVVTDDHHVSVDYKPFEIVTLLIEV